MQISDADSSQLQSATVTITNLKHGANEKLAANTSGTGISANYNTTGNQGILTLSGITSIADYRQVLRTITYEIDASVSNPDTTNRTIHFRVTDDSGLHSNVATATVNVIRPRITITVDPASQTVAKGASAQFTVTITNSGDTTLQNLAVSSSTVPDCNRDFSDLNAGATLPSYTCSITNVTARIDNLVKVSAATAQGGFQVSAQSTAVVHVPPDIQVNVAPDPDVGSVLTKGQNAKFIITLLNPIAGSELTNVEARATIAGVDQPGCAQSYSVIGVGETREYFCTISNVQAGFTIVIAATATMGAGSTQNSDSTRIDLADLSMSVTADPFQATAGEETPVKFDITLANSGDVSLTLTSLQSAPHGDLFSAANSNVSNNTCRNINKTLAAGANRSCSYRATIMPQLPAYSNAITAKGLSAGGVEATITQTGIVNVNDDSPMSVGLTANPPSLVAPGGTVDLTVQVTNNLPTTLALSGLTDSLLGDLDGSGTCKLPRNILAGDTYTCTYPATVSGKVAGDEVTFSITAVSDGEQESASTTIVITEPIVATTLLPAVASLAVAGEPNNTACSALPIITNLTYYFLPDDANDWYRFTIPAQSNLVVRLSDFTAEGQIVVWSGTCSQPVAIKNNGNFEPTKIVELGTLPPGTYFVWVISSGRLSSEKPYQLRIEASAP